MTIDTTPPPAPVITSVADDTGISGSDDITSDNVLTLNGTAEPNSTVTISEATLGVLGTASAEGGAWGFNPPARWRMTTMCSPPQRRTAPAMSARRLLLPTSPSTHNGAGRTGIRH